MSDLEEFSDPGHPFEEKVSHFTQAGQLHDLSLIQLRDQIKKIMIPLLIKTFQHKLELSQALSLPSRLKNHKNQYSPEEIIEQLKTLDNDLKVLLLWCQSCHNQIQKALSVPEEEQKSTTVAAPTIAPTNPAVSKSFSEAVSAQSSFFQQHPLPEKTEEPLIDSIPPPTQKSWWKKLTGK